LMLYDGKVQIHGTPEELKASLDPIVQQFINGAIDGPILKKKQ
jgi:phospholipid/cholesterol/gamma-HCH transport system ATP-binding protein